ncbi:hypothetical protein [Cnuibacter physcomitrellae]|uniref:hypothetical protein n=1 Tax=Cnuibacter physcomitrellae TaxID=1619308 RepID=UPI0012F4FBA7|nr:hypothetical protein [Cnuibacter physcomitrellae]
MSTFLVTLPVQIAETHASAVPAVPAAQVVLLPTSPGESVTPQLSSLGAPALLAWWLAGTVIALPALVLSLTLIASAVRHRKSPRAVRRPGQSY